MSTNCLILFKVVNLFLKTFYFQKTKGFENYLIIIYNQYTSTAILHRQSFRYTIIGLAQLPKEINLQHLAH